MSQIAAPPPDSPLPSGWRLRMDGSTRIESGGTVVYGGFPLRVIRLSARGAAIVRSWVDGTAVGESLAERRLARRLLDAGLAHPDPQPGADPRLAAATDEALGALAAEDRFILAAYFLDGHTLAEIGATLAVHESTISRRVERIIRDLRKRILKSLTQRGMSARAAEEALEVDVRDLALNVGQRLRPQKEEQA